MRESILAVNESTRGEWSRGRWKRWPPSLENIIQREVKECVGGRWSVWCRCGEWKIGEVGFLTELSAGVRGGRLGGVGWQ